MTTILITNTYEHHQTTWTSLKHFTTLRMKQAETRAACECFNTDDRVWRRVSGGESYEHVRPCAGIDESLNMARQLTAIENLHLSNASHPINKSGRLEL